MIILFGGVIGSIVEHELVIEEEHVGGWGTEAQQQEMKDEDDLHEINIIIMRMKMMNPRRNINPMI